jgi:hypothetical protein
MADNQTSETFALKPGWQPSRPVDPDTMVGVNLKLPAPLHRQLRLKAMATGVGLNQAIADAVSDWVTK